MFVELAVAAAPTTFDQSGRQEPTRADKPGSTGPGIVSWVLPIFYICTQ